MSDDIKKLVERLDEHWGRRRLGDMSCLFADAADALEAMAEKLQRETKAAGYWMERFCASENERDQMLIDLEEYRRDVEALVKERDHLKVVLVRTAASLAAAISLLETDGKATKKAAPSDKMFKQMLADYNHALDGARKALEAKE